MRRACMMLAALALVGCQGASSSSGVDAILRVRGGQVVSGDITEYQTDFTDAAVTGVTTGSNLIYPGLQGREVKGKVGPGASGVAIGLAGDGVFWALPGGLRDTVNPDFLLFAAQLDFSPELESSGLLQTDEDGRLRLPIVFRALTPEGLLGTPLAMDMRPIESQALGLFVITLEWTGRADLDLRVVAPASDESGQVEIWSKSGSNQSDGSSVDPNSPGVGLLDFDSNAGCDVDHRNRENVIWQSPPRAGRYEVRVDPFSLCGDVSAEWTARATYEGELITKSDGAPAEVFGLFTEASTRGGHGSGAGQMAFDFDLELRTR